MIIIRKAVGKAQGSNGTGIIYLAEQVGTNPGFFLAGKMINPDGSEQWWYIPKTWVLEHLNTVPPKGELLDDHVYIPTSLVEQDSTGKLFPVNGNYPRLFTGSYPEITLYVDESGQKTTTTTTTTTTGTTTTGATMTNKITDMLKNKTVLYVIAAVAIIWYLKTLK
jgi:hypothetical protein